MLVIDNYDSFTYNLVQCLRAFGAACEVRENDRIDVPEVLAALPDGIVISPGPGVPEQAGVSLALIQAVAGKRPILGVCLGHQAIALAFGARLERTTLPVHGKTSRVLHDGRGLFQNVPDGFEATRYHSLQVAPDSVPEELEVSARASTGEVMALRHRRMLVEGLQFHPESILTEQGPRLVQNWLGCL